MLIIYFIILWQLIFDFDVFHCRPTIDIFWSGILDKIITTKFQISSDKIST